MCACGRRQWLLHREGPHGEIFGVGGGGHDSNDSVPLAADTHSLGVLHPAFCDHQRDVVDGALGRASAQEVGVGHVLHQQRRDAAVHEALPCHHWVLRDRQNRHWWTVLGHKADSVPAGGEDNDQRGALVDGTTNGGSADGLAGAGALSEHRCRRQVEQLVVVDEVVCLPARLAHGGDCLDGVLPLGSLPAQHQTVCAIQHGVRDIRHLGARWAGVDDHALQHLSGTHHRLPSSIARSNDFLLGCHHLVCWDLNPEVAASHHDAVTGFQDLKKVVAAFLVLNLADDLDPRITGHLKEAFHSMDMLCLADKAGKDEVRPNLGCQLDVLDVLLAHGRKVQNSPWQVHTLPFTDGPVVVRNALEAAFCLGGDLKPQQPIVDVYHGPHTHHLGNVGVVHKNLWNS
mmetsp:Transcript_15323/g.42854  ORF Transcript_15323/g.42854 Transcript_15323/m.42854 type:complete len:401 (-) Transcript_15323:658-1860(-)